MEQTYVLTLLARGPLPLFAVGRMILRNPTFQVGVS